MVRDHSEQRLPVDWLSKGLRDAKCKSLLPYPTVARHDKDGNRREPGILKLLSPELRAVLPRHHEVEKDQARRRRATQMVQRFLPPGTAITW